MPRKRRGAGEGSIYKRKDGRWAASISLGGRRRKTFYGKTRQEVAEKMKQALYEQQQGMLATGKQTKLKDFLEQWLEEIKRPAIKPLSYEVYRDILDHHLLPSLGSITLQKLAAQDVARMLNEKRKAGLSEASIRRIRTVLRMALSQAVDWNLIARNVCDLVKLPKAERAERQVLTVDQARQLLEAARDHWLLPIVTIAITTGLRQGEILGLHWSDIDLEAGQLTVRRTVARVGREGIVASTPKTEGSKSVIALPGIVIETLRAHRAQQTVHLTLVFPALDGHYIPSSTVRFAFHRLLQEAGLPDVRFHDLRHSAATFLLSLGVPMKVVQEILRHSTINMTMDTYTHISLEMQQEAMSKMNIMFRKEDF